MNSLLVGRVGGSWRFLDAFLAVVVGRLGFAVFCLFAGGAPSFLLVPSLAPGAFFRGLLVPLSDLGCLVFPTVSPAAILLSTSFLW